MTALAEHERTSLRFQTLALEGLLWVAGVLIAALQVVRPLFGPGGFGWFDSATFWDWGVVPSVPVTVSKSALATGTPPALPTVGSGLIHPGQGLELAVPTGSAVTPWNPDFRQMAAVTGVGVLRSVLIVAVIALVIAIVRGMRHGLLFTTANVRRVYGIAAIVGIGGIAAELVGIWGRLGVIDDPVVAPYVVRDWSFSWLPLVAGFAIAVAAEIFRQGLRMRDDVDGLV